MLIRGIYCLIGLWCNMYITPQVRIQILLEGERLESAPYAVSSAPTSVAPPPMLVAALLSIKYPPSNLGLNSRLDEFKDCSKNKP